MENFKKTLELIWKEFFYGGHMQCVGTLAIVLVTAMLFKIKITWDCLIICYLMFYPMYLYNRFREIEIDSLTNPERTNYLKSYISKTPIIIFFIVLVLVFMMLRFTNLFTTIFGLLLLFLGLFYSEGVKKFTRFIPLLKNFYVGGFFAVLVIFPALYYNFHFNTAALKLSLFLFFILIFLKGIIMQIFLDIKDIEGDGQEGLKTLGVLAGKEKTITAIKILNVFLVLPIIVICVLLKIFPLEFLSLILVVPLDFYLLDSLKYKNYFTFIVVSGIFLFWLILIYTAKIFLIWF
ncbi:MAG: UbiA family prenyltransferase [bacterium]|nr:UbiA family prenyltransferase [bacterium]